MQKTGKCPKCDAFVQNVNVQDVIIQHSFGGDGWKGFTYSCQHCDAVLGVEINPLTLKSDIISGVVNALRGQ